MKTAIIKRISELKPGDLLRVEWTDASVGKASDCGLAIDIPVVSWGIYMGLLGQKNKHIVLAQNTFKYSDGFYDIDFTAIPVSWMANVVVLVPSCVDESAAKEFLNSFLATNMKGVSRHRRQQRVRIHRHQQRMKAYG